MAYQVNDNMGISDATIGISKTGLENYRQELQFSVINDTKKELRDYKAIPDAISTAWNGAAAQKFVNNLDKSVEKACDALDQISKAIDALFESVKKSMIKQDENMIKDDDLAF